MARKSAKNANLSKANVFVDPPEIVSSGRASGVKGVPLPTSTPAEEAAEKKREAAFLAEHDWKGRPLIGLTSGRWSLILQQRMPVSILPFHEAIAGDAWFADAIRILYFCATEPKDWRPFRNDAFAWQDAIDAWAAENVGIADRTNAETVAWMIYTQSKINRHEVAPPEKGAGSALGN